MARSTIRWGRWLAGAGVLGATALGLAWVGRSIEGDELDLEPWEVEAVHGLGVGHDEPVDPDEPAIGTGDPSDYCGPALGLLGGGESCLGDPLEDPRFAPVDRGAPFAPASPGALWPTITWHPSRLVVSYQAAEGWRGSSGRAFGSDRETDDGEARKHVGVDLSAKAGDPVVAPIAAKVLWVGPFYRGTSAVYLRAGDLVINLGEVADLSWRDFRLPAAVQLPGEKAPSNRIRPGVHVLAGQKLARVGAQEQGGATMLHLELYDARGRTDAQMIELIRKGKLRWLGASSLPPAEVYDPSWWLLSAALADWRRSMSGV